MDFSGSVGEWQRNVSEGPAGKSRRLAVIEALDVRAGQAFLDMGCGGGHLVKELGLATGYSGLVVGVDPSSHQLEMARTLCGSPPNIKLIEGSAADIPYDDNSFDGISALQTYEYVNDVIAALTEARRILKRGSPIVIVSILWDHCRFYGADDALNDQIFEAFKAHVFHQMLPMELPHLLTTTGFGSLTRKNLSYVDNALHEGAPGFYLSKLMALFAIEQGVGESDADKWLTQLTEADEKNRYGFVNFPVLTSASAI